MQYLYEIKNIINNKRYIGRTCNPDIRKKRHFRELEKNKHHCIFLQRAFNKYGKENFIFNIIDTRNTLKEIQELELSYINDNSNLYNVSNLSSGGDLISNHPNNDQIRKKISSSSKRRWENMSCEEKIKYCKLVTGINNPNYGNRGTLNPLYGKSLTKEHKEKISKAIRGKKKSAESIEKNRLYHIGKEPWNKGKKTGPLSLEHKQKLSAKNTGKPPINIRPVICEKYFFLSIYEAAKAYKISSTGILTRIKSNSKQFDSFYYFDKSCDNKNKYIRYSPETFSSSLIGKGHLSSRKVFCEGQIFNSLKEASNFYNISRETIRQRCRSNNKNWKEFYIIEE